MRTVEGRYIAFRYHPEIERLNIGDVHERRIAGTPSRALASGCYVSQKLDGLSTAQREKLKELFVKNKHPRFEKELAVSSINLLEKHRTTYNLLRMRTRRKW